MKLSVVIPFYNEENMIQKMYDELVKEINQITKAEFEIIFINDGRKTNGYCCTKYFIKEKRSLERA